MDAGYFIIAIMGCADGGASCTPVMTVPTRYESEAACAAAAPAALLENSNFDFPALFAQCTSAARPAAAQEPVEERASSKA
jgi:acyl-CoA synthetase (AMP-forming)/AMP-acid ligase II